MTGCPVTADLYRYLARQAEEEAREAYENQVARELAEEACEAGDVERLEKLLDDGVPEALAEMLSLALADPRGQSTEDALATLEAIRGKAREVREILAEDAWYALQDEVAQAIRAREEALAEARWEAAHGEHLWGGW